MGAHTPPATQLRAHPGPILTTFWPIAHQIFEFRNFWKYVRNRLAETRRMRYVSRESDKYFFQKIIIKFRGQNLTHFQKITSNLTRPPKSTYVEWENPKFPKMCQNILFWYPNPKNYVGRCSPAERSGIVKFRKFQMTVNIYFFTHENDS